MVLSKSFLTCFLFIGCLLLTQDGLSKNSTTFYYDDEFIKEFETVLKQHSLKDEDARLGLLWNEYLKSSTHFDNIEYQTACNQLETQYNKTLAELEECYKEPTEQEILYSSQWVDDLKKQFGAAYVLKNIDLIKLHLGYLFLRNSQNQCEEFKKETIYIECSYKSACSEYLGLYLDFIESLDKEQKLKLSKRKMALEELLEAFNKASVKDVLFVRAASLPLHSIAIKDRPDSDAELTEFFSNHPLFSKPFDLVGCVKDLKKLDSQ